MQGVGIARKEEKQKKIGPRSPLECSEWIGNCKNKKENVLCFFTVSEIDQIIVCDSGQRPGSWSASG